MNVVLDDDGARMRFFDEHGDYNSVNMSHGTIGRLARLVHVGQPWPRDTILKGVMPVGTLVTTPFGPGCVHRVAADSVGIILDKNGATLSYHREEVLERCVAVEAKR